MRINYSAPKEQQHEESVLQDCETDDKNHDSCDGAMEKASSRQSSSVLLTPMLELMKLKAMNQAIMTPIMQQHEEG